MTKIENAQLEGVRITVDAKRGTCHELLYREVQWETLQHSHNIQKWKMMYKIVNNEIFPTLYNLLLELVNQSTQYNLRTGENITVPFNLKEGLRSSFSTATKSMWNDLSQEIRNQST